MRMMTHGKAAANRGRCGGFFPRRSLSSWVRWSSSRHANRGLERSARNRGKSPGEARFVDAGADRVRREAPRFPTARLWREARSAPAPTEAPEQREGARGAKALAFASAR